MLVNILQSFDFGNKRYLPGDNPDVDPAIASRWVADGLATADTDQRQDNAVDAAALAASGFGFPDICPDPSIPGSFEDALDAAALLTNGAHGRVPDHSWRCRPANRPRLP